jgi:orotidine-5'-phosphate decarboxylase
MVERLGATISFYKVGLTLLARPGGVAFAHELRASGKMVFQDWKLHDIGAQVEGAACAVAEGGCDLLTVHAEPQVMRGAVKGRDAAGTGTKLLAVTVLTSLSDADLTDIGYGFSARDLVERRVRQALDCGVDGVVSSPLEAARVREIAVGAGRPDFLIITPGVRPEGADKVRWSGRRIPFWRPRPSSNRSTGSPARPSSTPLAGLLAVVLARRLIRARGRSRRLITGRFRPIGRRIGGIVSVPAIAATVVTDTVGGFLAIHGPAAVGFVVLAGAGFLI